MKETFVKLHIHFDGELAENEVYDKINKALGKTIFYIQEITIEENK